jgi:hypothetical protein
VHAIMNLMVPRKSGQFTDYLSDCLFKDSALSSQSISELLFYHSIA